MIAAITTPNATGYVILMPEVMIAEARGTAIPLPAACTLLCLETGGGRNVFGHDAVANPIPKGTQVTEASYAQYKAWRDQGLGNQGVGPVQLTWPGYQDRADQLGGCWRPEINMRVGFGAWVRTYTLGGSGRWGAYRAYNGSDAYADKAIALHAKWATVIGDAK